MVSRGTILALSVCCLSTAGCATVAVYDPGTAEFSLTGPRSELRTAADEYRQLTLDRGLAQGESTLGGLADLLLGRTDESNAYLRTLQADELPPAKVIHQVRLDIETVASGLDKVDGLARGLLQDAKPTRDDVDEFERVLICARQARESFSDAIARTSVRAPRDFDTAAELGALDQALARAVETADDLAAARAAANGSA